MSIKSQELLQDKLELVDRLSTPLTCFGFSILPFPISLYILPTVSDRILIGFLIWQMVYIFTIAFILAKYVLRSFNNEIETFLESSVTPSALRYLLVHFSRVVAPILSGEFINIV
jgi:hypothetical protein